MHAAIKTTTARKSSWTPERRRKHSLAMRRWKPWTRSTGPKTLAGKAVSSRNALKHGVRAATGDVRRLVTILRDQNMLVQNLMRVCRLARKYRYYLRPCFREALQKHILSKGLDAHKKITTNELFNLARARGLIAFPNRRGARFRCNFPALPL